MPAAAGAPTGSQRAVFETGRQYLERVPKPARQPIDGDSIYHRLFNDSVDRFARLKEREAKEKEKEEDEEMRIKAQVAKMRKKQRASPWRHEDHPPVLEETIDRLYGDAKRRQDEVKEGLRMQW